jgi:hypothetical protein
MSDLLNIWREIGTYNRFADTKNVVFLGLLFALAGFLNASQSNVAMSYLFGGNKTILFSCISLSSIACILALVPILKFPNLLIVDYYKPSTTSHRNPYYFYFIAEYVDAESWLKHLDPPLTPADEMRAKALAEQIWIISRIARRKFFLLKISVFIFGLGWICSWLYHALWS